MLKQNDFVTSILVSMLFQLKSMQSMLNVIIAEKIKNKKNKNLFDHDRKNTIPVKVHMEAVKF